MDVKAVIMAGGMGTRLRPISCGIPKPMTPLFGRPVMEHAVRLLKKHGFTDMTAALCHLPEQIRGYFGDGSAFGVKMRYCVEETPLGTAGAVKNCGFSPDDELIVISGDGVCDFDLTACLRFHRERRADATIVTYRSDSPLEYGLVLCAPDGRVERFIEKPSWEQVLTDRVNTGIYILRASVLDELRGAPPWDFAGDLFPLLKAGRRALYAVEAEGCWHDIGSCEAYLKCCRDVLDGRLRLELPEQKTGLHASVRVFQPSFIAENAELGEGCVVGPYAAVLGGSRVGRGSLVQRSVLMGAALGERVTAMGAVCCRGCVAGNGAEINEGCVLGEGAKIGKNAVLTENVKLWPRREAPEGARVTESLVSGSLRTSLRFSSGGVVSGEAGAELGAAEAVALGRALAAFGKIGVGTDGSRFSEGFAQAVRAGARLGGAEALRCDARFPMQASFAAELYGLSCSIFVGTEDGHCRINFFSENGLPPERRERRRLEQALARGEAGVSARAGGEGTLAGVPAAYVKAAANGLRANNYKASLASGGENEALSSAFSRMGAETGGEGPRFEVCGGTLLLRDEDGISLSPDEIALLLTLCALENGLSVKIPPHFPAAADVLASDMGKPLARGEDCPRFLRDGVFSACLILSRLSAGGERLSAIRRRLPRSFTRRASVPVASRGALMRSLCEKWGVPEGELLRNGDERGWVSVRPSSGAAALDVLAESSDAEYADELCADAERLLRRLAGE